MRRKKDIPLVILESLEPFIIKSTQIYKVVEPKKSLLRIEDLDDSSDFYFEVVDFSQQNGKTYLQLDFKPHSKIEISNHRPKIQHTQLSTIFEEWEKILKEYENIKSIYTDPIISNNAKYFYDKYEILEDDASTTSFNLEQVLYLEEYLEEVKTILNNFKDGIIGEELEQIEELEFDVESIKNSLTKEPKNTIIRRLAFLWGKSQKVGLPLIKDIFIKVIAEISSKLLLGP